MQRLNAGMNRKLIHKSSVDNYIYRAFAEAEADYLDLSIYVQLSVN